MGHRTLNLKLVLRGWFFDREAFDAVSEDDAPFVEGLFLVALLAVFAAALSAVGQALAWATLPSASALKETLWAVLQQQGGWAAAAQSPAMLLQLQRNYETAWLFLPTVLGLNDPRVAMLNLLAWPVLLIVSWLIYGSLAHGFARLLGGHGVWGQTLGTVALSFTPWLLRGLGVFPFVTLGGVLMIWQWLLRYQAIRSAHGLTRWRALAATLLPLGVYVLVGSLGIMASILAAFVMVR